MRPGDGIWENRIILALLFVPVPTSTMSSYYSLWFGKLASEDGVFRGESGGVQLWQAICRMVWTLGDGDGDGDGAIEGYSLQEESCPRTFCSSFIPPGWRCKNLKSLGAARGKVGLENAVTCSHSGCRQRARASDP
jgi:hypothetical protein